MNSVPHSALRGLVARYPVSDFLVMAYTITIVFALPPIRTRVDILPPGLPFWDVLATIFGVWLPAFLVVAMAAMLTFVFTRAASRTRRIKMKGGTYKS